MEERIFSKWGQIVAGRVTKWTTILVWVIVAVVLSVSAPSVNKEVNPNAGQLPVAAPSIQATRQIEQAFPSQNGTPALIVWYRAGGLTTPDLSLIQKADIELSQHPVAGQMSVPPLGNLPVGALAGLRSKDGTTFVLPVTFTDAAASSSQLPTAMTALHQRIDAAVGGHPFASSSLSGPGLHARITGPIGITVDALGLFGHLDITLLAATSLLVLILLILLYRSPLLAIVPLICVGVAYSVISPILGWLAERGVIVVDSQGVSIMTVLLFGAGTDYCLFMVARYREALFTVKDRHQAIREAVRGASGAIAMSGLTVVLALFTLILAQSGAYHRFAAPFSVAVLIMALAGITFVPALLAVLGRASFFPFVPRTEEQWQARVAKRPRLARRSRATGAPGGLSRWAGKVVTRRPWTVVIVTVIVLGALGLGSLGIKTTYNLLSTFPSTMPSRQGFTLLADHFGAGTLAPVQVLVKGAENAGDRTAVTQSLRQLSSISGATLAKSTPTEALWTITLSSNPESNAAMNALPDIKQTVASTLRKEGAPVADTIWIAGQTATQADTKTYNDSDTARVIPVVILIIAVLLLLYLRSIVATVYLLATVLLSYFAALGTGWLVIHYVLHTSAMQGAIPLYAFVFLVALGEDYNIFMISRIWQGTRTLPLRDAIAQGVSRTGSVITSAGLILAGTFAVLASLPLQVLVQFGLVTAIGVLLDTFVVRPFLVPSVTSLLGQAAFWPRKVPTPQGTGGVV